MQWLEARATVRQFPSHLVAGPLPHRMRWWLCRFKVARRFPSLNFSATPLKRTVTLLAHGEAELYSCVVRNNVIYESDRATFIDLFH